jgi:glutathione S-transferase
MELDDGTVMFESLACCLYLADAHPGTGLLGPEGSTQRALGYQWSVFSMTEIEGALMALRAMRDAEADVAPGLERFGKALKVIADALGQEQWLVGDTFGVADVMTASVLGIAHSRNMLGDWPTLGAYVERGHARPAYERGQLAGAAA